MAIRYIPITISNELVYGDGVSVGAKGSNDDVYLQITFGEFWEGLSKHITWENAHGEKTIVYFSNEMYDDTNDMYNIPVPVEAKRYEGNIHASIRGTLAGRSSMTAWMTFIVQPAIYDSQYEEEQNPTGTIADQLQEQMDAQQDEISRISEAIDLERLQAIADQAYEAYVNATEALTLVRDSAVLGVKGNLEESYRTGQVNLTPADIGAVALEAGKGLSTNDYTTAEKSKLAGIPANANYYVHPSYTAVNSGLYKVKVDSTGHVSGTTAVTKSDITALGIPAQDTNTTYSVATTSANGLMSTAMVTKLAGITEGANKYTHPTYTARTGVPTGNVSPAFGGTFSVSQPTSDGTGHITAINSRTITLPVNVNSLLHMERMQVMNGAEPWSVPASSVLDGTSPAYGYSPSTGSWYPLGIIGYAVAGNGLNNIAVQKLRLTEVSGNTFKLNYRFKNLASTAQTISIYIDVLYARVS